MQIKEMLLILSLTIQYGKLLGCQKILKNMPEITIIIIPSNYFYHAICLQYSA
jgi:hypothetical protein